jgi:hypothetical protein
MTRVTQRSLNTSTSPRTATPSPTTPKPIKTLAEKDKFKYKVEIQQMMFVSGETGEPSPETTGIIEEMVRGQVIEMVASPSRPPFPSPANTC